MSRSIRSALPARSTVATSGTLISGRSCPKRTPGRPPRHGFARPSGRPRATSSAASTSQPRARSRPSSGLRVRTTSWCAVSITLPPPAIDTRPAKARVPAASWRMRAVGSRPIPTPCRWSSLSSRTSSHRVDFLATESWRNRKTLILSRTDMMGLVTAAEYVACVEHAYRMHGEGRYYMDPKGHIVLDKYPGEWEAMPSYIEDPEAAACKWVSIREQNRERFDLPTVFSILIYTHPETGFPLAICDGSYHTVMRTGAAAAVSAKWLARPESDVLAIVRGAHVVVTVTPARGPIVQNEWIAPGTHVAAVGADKGGDQELDPRILQRARIFVDDIRQCRTDGEINVPLAEGLISEGDIAGEIGEVIAGRKPGRTSDGEVTVFDSTGIALQDSATVPLEYERALAAGVGIEKKMIST